MYCLMFISLMAIPCRKLAVGGFRVRGETGFDQILSPETFVDKCVLISFRGPGTVKYS